MSRTRYCVWSHFPCLLHFLIDYVFSSTALCHFQHNGHVALFCIVIRCHFFPHSSFSHCFVSFSHSPLIYFSSTSLLQFQHNGRVALFFIGIRTPSTRSLPASQRRVDCSFAIQNFEKTLKVSWSWLILIMEKYVCVLSVLIYSQFFFSRNGRSLNHTCQWKLIRWNSKRKRTVKASSASPFRLALSLFLSVSLLFSFFLVVSLSLPLSSSLLSFSLVITDAIFRRSWKQATLFSRRWTTIAENQNSPPPTQTNKPRKTRDKKQTKKLWIFISFPSILSELSFHSFVLFLSKNSKDQTK